MEDINNNDRSSSYSWWWDSHNRSNYSQWLQKTLLDLDNKTKVMLNLIQEDGDTFAQRAEMYYKKRPDLIKMVEDFHRSYRSLAEKHDQLKSESVQAANLRSIPILNSLKQAPELQICNHGNTGDDTKLEAPFRRSELHTCNNGNTGDTKLAAPSPHSELHLCSYNGNTDDTKLAAPSPHSELHICSNNGNIDDTKLFLEAPNCRSELVIQDLKRHEYDKSDVDFDILNGLSDELVLSVPRKNVEAYPKSDGEFNGRMTKKTKATLPNTNNVGNGVYQFQIMGDQEREKMWNGMRLKVSKLIDDNLRHQDELIRRNDEKREAIKDLYCEINKLMDENRALKSSLTCYNHVVDVKKNQSLMSRLKGLILKLSQ